MSRHWILNAWKYMQMIANLQSTGFSVGLVGRYRTGGAMLLFVLFCFRLWKTLSFFFSKALELISLSLYVCMYMHISQPLTKCDS